MLKKIWQSFMRWFRKSFRLQPQRAKERLAVQADLPPLDDADREYLFMQLLEGVTHGWQQPRAVAFFNNIRRRVTKSEWLEWMDRFGQNLLNSPVPNYELAGRMVQLSELHCGDIGDRAGEYGLKLLNRQTEEFTGNMLPIMEFGTGDDLNENIQFAVDNRFDEVPPELLIDNDPLATPPTRSFGYQSEPEYPVSETREITLEEFSAMLYQDPNLVAELAAQFGIETDDPQVIVNNVVAQMQQQVQQISGDLSPNSNEINPPTPPETPPVSSEITPIPETPLTPPIPLENPPAPQTPPTMLNATGHLVPPPPPKPKLEYKAEDPWGAPVEDSIPKPASSNNS